MNYLLGDHAPEERAARAKKAATAAARKRTAQCLERERKGKGQ
jgi:hypothetical protein